MGKNETNNDKNIVNIDLLELDSWKKFKESSDFKKVKKPEEIKLETQQINDFKDLLKKAAIKSYENEQILLEKIGSIYKFDENNLNNNVNQNISWMDTFNYLKINNDKEDIDYWIEIIKTVSSQQFVTSIINSAKKIAYKISPSKKDSSLTTPSLFTKKIKSAYNNLQVSFSQSGLLRFKGDNVDITTGKMNVPSKIINDTVNAYSEGLKEALNIISESLSEEEKENFKIEDICLSAKKSIERVYTDVYKVMWRRAALKNMSGVKSETDIVKKLEELGRSSDINVATGTYGYKKLLFKKNGWELFLAGDNIELYRTEGSQNEGNNSGDLDKNLKNIKKKDNETFVKQLVEIIFKTIVSFIGSEQSKKEQPEITDDRIKNKATQLLKEHFENYRIEFEKKNGLNGTNKDGKNLYDAYIVSLFGNTGVKNRESKIQGTLGEILFSTFLTVKVDGLTKKDFSDRMKNPDNEEKLTMVYINGQEVNSSEQQAHDDVVVMIGTKKIGIQVKQYNSKNISSEGESFYAQDYNFFGQQAFSAKGLGRYLTIKGENNNENIEKIIEYLRKISLLSEDLSDIDVTSVLYPHFLRFARIRDDLESGVENLDDLTYNNFYVFNFSLIPTSQIISQVIINIDKDLNNKNENNKGIFKIKPTKVQNNANYFYISDDFDLTYKFIDNENKEKIKTAEGRLNFVGLSVKPSRWYDFSNF